MAVLKDLIVHGPSRFINTAQFESLNTNKIGAEEGVFNKIVATTGDIGSLTVEDLTAGKATVLSLLDVRGELHTNQWTNSNIATIDGSFYITPTIGIPEGTMTTTANSLSVYGSNFPISSVYVNGINSDNTAGTVAWATGSKVLVTGEILVNGTYMPLGTLVGTLGSNVTASRIDISSITDNRYQTAASLAEIGTQSTALPCRNVKVSLYQTSRKSTLYPLGIFMTALGENGKTFLDIYGGGYATSTATAGGFAKPVLRIGNLAGLPDVGGKTPVGYGIYTSNGFFEGAIVAKEGYIGNTGSYWTIGGGTSAGATYMYSGPSTVSATSTAGTYLGTNGFLNTASSTTYAQITNGVLTAQGAVISGTIDATSFKARDSNQKVRAEVNTNGLLIYDSDGTVSTNGTLLAQFGSTTQIGKSAQAHINITSSGMQIYQGGISVAEFGETARIGRGDSGRITIQSSGMRLFGGDGTIELANIGYGEGGSSTHSAENAPFYTFGIRIVSAQPYSTAISYQPANVVINTYDDQEWYYVCKEYTSGEWDEDAWIRTVEKPSQNPYLTGNYSHVEGVDTIAMSAYSHAEGRKTTAASLYAHAEGCNTVARGADSHAEGNLTAAEASHSHAEGIRTYTTGVASHTEGGDNTASGSASHAEGGNTIASGRCSHAGGEYTVASGRASRAIGNHTEAVSKSQLVAGAYNITDTVTETLTTVKTGHSVLSLFLSYETTHVLSVTPVGQTPLDPSVYRLTTKYNPTTEEEDQPVIQFSDLHGIAEGDSVEVVYAKEKYPFIIGNGNSEARSNAFAVDWNGDIYPQNTKMADFVVEQGTDGIWTYRKWNSGISECWGRYTWNITTWAAWGSWYYSNASSAVNYPTNLFIEAPSLTTNGRMNGLDCALYCRSGTDVATNTATFAFFRPSGGTTGTGQLSLYAIGKWK